MTFLHVFDLLFQDSYGERAAEIIEEHNTAHPDEPMFMYLAFQAPHTPQQVRYHLENKQ